MVAIYNFGSVYKSGRLSVIRMAIRWWADSGPRLDAGWADTYLITEGNWYLTVPVSVILRL